MDSERLTFILPPEYTGPVEFVVAAPPPVASLCGEFEAGWKFFDRYVPTDVGTKTIAAPCGHKTKE